MLNLNPYKWRLILCLCLSFLPKSVLAQALAVDLDRDGHREKITIIGPDRNGLIGIRIVRPNRATVVARDLAFQRSVEHMPRITTNRLGSLQLETFIDDGFRSTISTLIIGYRQQSYRVIGQTHHEYETDSPQVNVTCDINYATGNANYRRSVDSKPTFTVPAISRPITTWSASTPLPERCSLADHS